MENINIIFENLEIEFDKYGVYEKLVYKNHKKVMFNYNQISIFFHKIKLVISKNQETLKYYLDFYFNEKIIATLNINSNVGIKIMFNFFNREVITANCKLLEDKIEGEDNYE